MVIVTEFDIGDTVSCGTILDARIVRISMGQSITYTIVYWDDNKAIEYTAYDWELQLEKKMTSKEQ